jgi:hypothetical protein
VITPLTKFLGVPTVLLGVATFFILPNNAESAGFLSEEEKSLLVLRRSREHGQTAAAQAFSKVDVYKAFKDWKVWVFWCAQFGCGTM